MACTALPSFIATLALLFGLPSITGCATLFAGAPTELTVAVEEPSEGAVVTVEALSGGEQVSPQGGHDTFYLKRATDYKVKVAGDGYAAREFVVGRKPHPAAAFNAMPLLASLYILPMSFIASSYSVPGQEAPESRANRLMLGTLAVAGAMFAIDFFTGKLYQHEVDQLRVRLEKAPEAQSR